MIIRFIYFICVSLYLGTEFLCIGGREAFPLAEVHGAWVECCLELAANLFSREILSRELCEAQLHLGFSVGDICTDNLQSSFRSLFKLE